MGEIVTAVSDAGLGVIQLVESSSSSNSRAVRRPANVKPAVWNGQLSNTVIGLARRFVDHEK